MRYYERLSQRIQEIKSPLCVGLDPRLERFEGSLARAEQVMSEIIDETAELAAAFKPNMAYFEVMGIPGLELLERVLERIPDEVPVILDAKRSDIGETQKYYAKTYFEHYAVDAVTLSPFMGYDSLEPFLAYEGKGIYALALTSNAGSADFMRLPLADGQPVYLKVAELAARAKAEGAPADLGFVMGLTNLGQAEVDAFPDEPLLIPGLGAQGGDLSALANGKPRSAPNVINASRGIMFPNEGESYRQAAERYVSQLSPLITS